MNSIASNKVGLNSLRSISEKGGSVAAEFRNLAKKFASSMGLTYAGRDLRRAAEVVASAPRMLAESLPLRSMATDIQRVAWLAGEPARMAAHTVKKSMFAKGLKSAAHDVFRAPQKLQDSDAVQIPLRRLRKGVKIFTRGVAKLAKQIDVGATASQIESGVAQLGDRVRRTLSGCASSVVSTINSATLPQLPKGVKSFFAPPSKKPVLTTLELRAPQPESTTVENAPKDISASSAAVSTAENQPQTVLVDPPKTLEVVGGAERPATPRTAASVTWVSVTVLRPLPSPSPDVLKLVRQLLSSVDLIPIAIANERLNSATLNWMTKV